MRASQVFRYRTVQNGVTVEMVIWALPRPSAERSHGLKCRLLEDFREDRTRLAGWRWR
jgi:hypothetical protein